MLPPTDMPGVMAEPRRAVKIFVFDRFSGDQESKGEIGTAKTDKYDVGVAFLVEINRKLDSRVEITGRKTVRRRVVCIVDDTMREEGFVELRTNTTSETSRLVSRSSHGPDRQAGQGRRACGPIGPRSVDRSE
jgi:hypothetical protein